MFKHLSNINPQIRESEAIFRFFSIYDMPICVRLLYSLNSRFYIICQNIPYNYILESTELEGDIDVCLIPCNMPANYSNDYIITDFMPEFDKIIGIEVKVSYFNLNNKIKSNKFKKIKNQTKCRKQAEKLCKTGFNDVCLLYMITTEPEETVFGNINDWIIAGDRASTASDKIRDIIFHNENDCFSTITLFIGALSHKMESYASCDTYEINHSASKDNINDKKNVFRKSFENKIRDLFPMHVPTIRFPIQIRACSNNSCKNLYLLFQGQIKNCPKCNSVPI